MFRKLIREDRIAKMAELTASLSHELNQPLTAILFSAQAGKQFLAVRQTRSGNGRTGTGQYY